MKPIPVDFHIGPLQIHTYGIGLAITFYFAYRYFEKRLRDNELPWEWLSSSVLWIIGAAIIGARIVHVIANIKYYISFPIEVFAIWHGGLSSFGGIAGAIPVALYILRKKAPDLRPLVALDLITPVLMASWAMGRILGPQLMYAGGGRVTNAWYGLQYAGQVGYRIPVPVFQATEDFIIFLVSLQLEKFFRAKEMPTGTLLIATIGLWSVERFFDEFLWLAVPRLWDAVEVFSIILFVFSIFGLIMQIRKKRRLTAEPDRQDLSNS